ncbi:HEPN domain-containing protein [Leptolyngbya sp. CCNP1308]|uniref:HEPN domain-containing protein n=1 Tax=Leptolyngbya sp. CCNP1308 TaxID=3110255 RepID=UPI002B20BF88|nr:HEPN domain-containing protein [Leptolyngbya sp. CCNP1308]MEA5452106.1 HEPN domain-containing protein [Leptolyngbya sp. CCNP1308]
MTAKSNLPKAWFAKAETDLQAAELLLNTANPLRDIVCYHAQQCAEKYLKGYLIACEVPFKFVHELAYLTQLCIEQEPEFSKLIDVASELQDYATGVRYPDDDLDEPTFEEAQRAVACAKEV